MDVSKEVFKPPKAAKGKAPVLNPLAPQWPFRGIAVGRSGSGKTNAVLALISEYVPWQVIAVHARHLDNPQYTGFRAMVEKWEAKHEKVVSVWSDNLKDLADVESLEPTQRKLVIIDDFVLEKDQQRIVEYFVSGRHKNTSILYISQSYFKIPKTIRDNATHLLVFKGMNAFDRAAIWKDACATMTKEQFERFYATATAKPYGFIVVDRDPTMAELMYRIGFDELYLPDPSF